MRFIIGLLLLGFLPCNVSANIVCIDDDNGVEISCADDKASKPKPIIPWNLRFFQGTEAADMQHRIIDGVPVILDTDFIQNSTNSARVVDGIMQIKESGVVFALIERRGHQAILIDKKGFDGVSRDILNHASRCNSSQCTTGIIAGVLKNGVLGAASGGTIGAFWGPKGAIGGVVIGGSVGMVYGALEAYATNPACNCTEHGKNSSNVGDGHPGFGPAPHEPEKDEDLIAQEDAP